MGGVISRPFNSFYRGRRGYLRKMLRGSGHRYRQQSLEAAVMGVLCQPRECRDLEDLAVCADDTSSDHEERSQRC